MGTMEKWSLPPRIKIYEALGAIADGRLTLTTPGAATVLSSSGNKTYNVTYNAETGEVTSNDNGSYWQGYLGYPAIAYFMAKGILQYESTVAAWLKGIAWKDVNTKFENDYVQTEALVRSYVIEAGGDLVVLDSQINKTTHQLTLLPLRKGASLNKPPGDY